VPYFGPKAKDLLSPKKSRKPYGSRLLDSSTMVIDDAVVDGEAVEVKVSKLLAHG